MVRSWAPDLSNLDVMCEKLVKIRSNEARVFSDAQVERIRRAVEAGPEHAKPILERELARSGLEGDLLNAIRSGFESMLGIRLSRIRLVVSPPQHQSAWATNMDQVGYDG